MVLMNLHQIKKVFIHIFYIIATIEPSIKSSSTYVSILQSQINSERALREKLEKEIHDLRQVNIDLLEKIGPHKRK